MKLIKSYKIKLAMPNSCKVSLKFWILGFFLMLFDVAKAQFIFTVKTDNPGASLNNQFTIPTNNTSPHTYNYNVNWGDSSPDDLGVTGDIVHTYSVVGTYTITITGDFPQIYFNSSIDSEKLLSIEQWGINPWKSFKNAFYGCRNLVINATDTPNLTNVTDMSQMFRLARSFNQNIGNWDVSNVKNMLSMFQDASSFNQDIGSWNTSNVEDMSGLFADATNFNKSISNWDTSKVQSMYGMFAYATSFNQDIGNWNTSLVSNMSAMFAYASSFNQDIGNWDVSSLTNAILMFSGTTNLSIQNYDSLLKGWNAQILKPGVIFDGGTSHYCAGAFARLTMIANDGWNISDGGSICVHKKHMRHGKSVDNGVKNPMKF